MLPTAINFLQNFNDDNFDILIQAQDYYKFSIMVLAAMGLLFQVPIGILAVTRTGIVTPRQLRKNRRYAILVIAVVAMLLPGQDPVTMLMLMVPLSCSSRALSSWPALVDRRVARNRAREEAEMADSDDERPRQRTTPISTTRCCSTSEAPAAATPSRRCTCCSPC